MEICLSINTLFDSVFLINGKLSECKEIFFENNSVVYITVLPLDASLLPYTIKLVGTSVKSNQDLCRCYQLAENKYYLKLLPRYNYVYSVMQENPLPDGLIERFFALLSSQRLAASRDYLCQELNDSIDDDSLQSFFDGFVDIVCADKQDGLYYLITNQNKGVLYKFSVKGTLIENIIEANTQ